MFMAPQHMQQLDLYHESLVERRVAAVSPYHWGVVTAEIDAAALAGGQLRISRFDGILPGGLPLTFQAGEPVAPAPRPIGASFPSTQRELEVFLGAPRERDGVPSFLGPRVQQGKARFSTVHRQVADATANGAEASVGFGQPNLEVLFGADDRDDYDAIKIAEVVRDKTGGLIVNDTYIPPCLRIDASPFITASLRRLLATMTAKHRELADQRSQRDGASAEFGSGDVTRYLQLSALSGAIPVLNHLAETGALSPHTTYLWLLQLGGQLSSFALEGDPTKFPAFFYHDLRTTFEELFARVTGLLHATFRERYVPLPLEVRSGMHIGRLESDRLASCRQFVLGVKVDLPEAQTMEHLPKLSKIASWNQIENIVRSATPGVPLQAVHRPPAEIPIKAGTVYFNLYVQDQYWQTIVRERTIAIVLPPPFDPSRTRIELMGIPGPTAQGR